MKRIGAWCVLVAAVLLLTACGGGATATTTHTLHGYLSLVDSEGNSITAQDGACQGTGGYSDIGEGAGVTVTDGAGTVLATGSLSGGGGTAYECNFNFAIEVPDADFYRVEVSHRGEMTYSRQQMDEGWWMIFLTLGS